MVSTFASSRERIWRKKILQKSLGTTLRYVALNLIYSQVTEPFPRIVNYVFFEKFYLLCCTKVIREISTEIFLIKKTFWTFCFRVKLSNFKVALKFAQNEKILFLKNNFSLKISFYIVSFKHLKKYCLKIYIGPLMIHLINI